MTIIIIISNNDHIYDNYYVDITGHTPHVSSNDFTNLTIENTVSSFLKGKTTN
jgi:hypothetical protein